jgi:PAS domain S-box-containing protein
MLSDITDRKGVDAQLATTLRELGDVKAAIDEHAIVAMTDGEGHITYVNQKFCDISKYSREELIGRDHRIVNSGFHPKAFFRNLWQTIGSGRVWKGEIRNKAKDGSYYWVDTTIVPRLGENGQPIQYIAIRADVTERHQLDQTLQDKNLALAQVALTAEKSNVAKSEFLSSMSHELRSPLNAILGFAQLMESGSPLPTPNQSASIGHILRAGWYLLELIDEILDLALIESGKLSLVLEPVLLSDVMRDCQAMVEAMAQTKGIRMNFPEFNGSCFVSADRTRLKQVVINLLSNAIKYNRAGGLVEVTCVVSPNQRLRISVRDTGEGLSPEKLGQLFQSFNRLGQENKAEQGTGIGLVVSKRLVELMAGTMGVQSTVGVGSTFWFDMDLSAAHPADTGIAIMPDLPVPPVAKTPVLRTLLYVEDNLANMELVEQLIGRRPDMRLLGAADAVRGIALARTHQPNVILMDINLPGVSGLQALQILRGDPLTAHIPVIAISANAMPNDIKAGQSAGFFCYLTKPIKITEFMAALDQSLEFAKCKSCQ